MIVFNNMTKLQSIPVILKEGKFFRTQNAALWNYVLQHVQTSYSRLIYQT